MNTFERFTALGTRWLRRVDTEPFTKARVIVFLSYCALTLTIVLIFAHISDTVSREIFRNAFLYPDQFTLADAAAQVDIVRWNIRFYMIALIAIGVYFLLGMALEPIRRSAEFQKRFIANISHELKTPLTLAKTEAEVALRNKEQLTKEEAVALLEKNRDDIAHFSRIIHFLTVLSDLSDQKIRNAAQPVAPADIVERVVRYYAERTDCAQIRVTDATEAKILGNPVAIEKLVSNLVRNSLAHTSVDGHVELATRKVDARVVLSVTDTGVGIPREDIPRLFEPFFRASTSSKEGSGLGLSIVKEIARIHNAPVSVTSEVGKGTTVSVAFPVVS